MTSLLRNQSSERLKVSRITVHPGFTSSPYLRHDIALFKITSMPESAAPICLDTSASDLCYVVGWGSVDGSGNCHEASEWQCFTILTSRPESHIGSLYVSACEIVWHAVIIPHHSTLHKLSWMFSSNLLMLHCVLCYTMLPNPMLFPCCVGSHYEKNIVDLCLPRQSCDKAERDQSWDPARFSLPDQLEFRR